MGAAFVAVKSTLKTLPTVAVEKVMTPASVPLGPFMSSTARELVRGGKLYAATFTAATTHFTVMPAATLAQAGTRS